MRGHALLEHNNSDHNCMAAFPVNKTMVWAKAEWQSLENSDESGNDQFTLFVWCIPSSSL